MRRLCPLVFFVLMGVLTFWKPIFHSEFTLLSGGDICAQTYPWFNAAAHWLKEGVLLLWDPYVYAGKATLGELQPGLLYPPNWLFMLIPEKGTGINAGGLEFLIIVHYILAGLFAYLLGCSLGMKSRGALASGIAFAIGGYSTQLYAWVNIFCGFVWLPLVFLLFRKAMLAESWSESRRFLLWSGICLSLSFLAGHHAAPIHCGLIILLNVIFKLIVERKSTGWRAKADWICSLVALPAVAGLLTAVQWLPSAEWARHVWRWVGEGDPVQWGQKIPYTILQRTGNLSPQDSASLLFPYMEVGANIYVGAAVLFLALVGFLFSRSKDAKFFGLASVLYFFLSWGQFTVLHGWLNTFVPTIWFAREVYLYLIPLQLCVAMLAGFGLDCVMDAYASTPDRVFGIFIRRAGWTMVSLVIVGSVLGIAAHMIAGMPLHHVYIRRVYALAANLAVLASLLYFLHTRRMQAPTFGYCMLALILIDLSSQFSISIRTSDQTREQSNPAALTYWKIPIEAEYLKELRQKEVFRADDPARIFPPNFGDAWLIEETMGHGATARVDYLDFRSIDWGPASNASALLNTRYFVSRIPVPGMPKVFEAGSAIYRNPRAVPRVFVPSRYRAIEGDKEIRDWIRSPLFAPSNTVILRQSDLEKVPAAFLRTVQNEDEGIEVRAASYTTVAEIEAEKTADQERRHMLAVFHAPWGWSPGDNATLAVRPKTPVPRCFFILSYYPAGFNPSEIAIKISGNGKDAQMPVLLRSLQPGEQEAVVQDLAVLDIGPLAAAEYQLSLVVPPTCTARLDSMRISLSPPAPGDVSIGEAVLTSFKPNRLKITTELRRSSFVTVSDLFYAGWEATVDGKPAPVLEGDYILRSIPVAAGRHEIVLRFRSKTFEWGLAVSLVSLVCVGFLLSIRHS